MVNITGLSALSLARSMIPSFIDKSLSRNAGLSLLKAGGIGVRRQDFLKLWSEISGMKQVEERAKFTPRKFRPTVHTITPSTKQYTQPFNNVFKVREGTNHPLFMDGQYLSINSDTLIPIEDLAQRLSISIDEFGNYERTSPLLAGDLVYVGTMRRMEM